jgi:hypothetical protein
VLVVEDSRWSSVIICDVDVDGTGGCRAEAAEDVKYEENGEEGTHAGSLHLKCHSLTVLRDSEARVAPWFLDLAS